MGLVNCKSISDLPSPKFLIEHSRDLTFVTLPLVCLAMIHEVGWGFGFLLVTDFTDNFRSSFFNNNLPKKVPDEFVIGGHQLERGKVFSISIPSAKIDSCWAELTKFSASIGKYHFLNYLTSNFASEGVVALVNFRVKTHNDSVEGFLARLLVCNRHMMSAPSNKELLMENGFKDFMARYSKYIDVQLYDSLMPTFPIDQFVKRSSVSASMIRPAQKSNQMITQANEPPAKVRRLVGALVMFQQQFTQTQQPQLPEQSDDSQLSEDESNVSIGHTQNGHNLTSSGANNALPNHTSSPVLCQRTGTAENTDVEKWNLFAINDVTFSVFAGIPCHLVKSGTAFNTKCQVYAIQPDAKHVLTKPFKRTLKIPSISLFLAQGSDLVKIELHTEQEKCRFLGLEETEEAINKVEKITNGLHKLCGTEVDISIAKRVMTLDFGYQRLYWSTATTLDSMIKR